MIVLGIDPGNDGAFALYDHARKHILWIEDMPTYKISVGPKRHTRLDQFRKLMGQIALEKAKQLQRPRIDTQGVLDIIRLAKDLDVDFAVLEGVNARPRQSGMFTFGRGYGNIEMALTAEDIPFEPVAPSIWKPKMMCDADKTLAVGRADQVFPDQQLLFRTKHRKALKPDRAEAALMARFGAEFMADRVKTK